MHAGFVQPKQNKVTHGRTSPFEKCSVVIILEDTVQSDVL